MTGNTYTVARGDSLWKICASSEIGPKISGNNIPAKINTLVSLNNIPNSNLIYPGQVLTLSSSGGASSSSTTQTQAQPSNCVKFEVLGLQADSSTGRDVFASWVWTKDKTKGFKIRWEWDKTIDGVSETQYQESETTTPGIRYATFTVPDEVRKYNNWVQIFVTPIAEFTKDASGNETKTPHWTADQAGKQYHFKDNPPFTPENPTCEIDETTLTMKIESIAKEKDAASIIFQVVKDNSSAIYTSLAIPVVAVTDDYGTVSHQHTVPLGSSYKVRANAVGGNGKQSGWTAFSNEVETKPAAPSGVTAKRNKRSDNSISAYLEWTAVPNASKYKVEYTTVQEDFNTTTGSVTSAETEDSRTYLEIANIEAGKDYFFRVRSINKTGIESDPSEVITLPIGEPPAAPTTRSTANSAFEGDTMELNWIHNSVDGSAQTFAELSLKIGDSDWASYVYTNTTDAHSGEEKVIDDGWMYGQGISYKGSLYFKMDTTMAALCNQKIQWKVRTAGVTDAFSDTAWSVERTIYIYEKPVMEMSMTKDSLGETGLIETLNSFPFYINSKVVFDTPDYVIQKPVGYHVRIAANEYYVTVDDDGTTKTINAGDSVYERYFSTDGSLSEEISANDVDLESGINYTLYCTVDLSTGLTLTGSHEFGVSWTDVTYNIQVDIGVDENSYVARISPYCIDSETGNFVENVTLSVYRREYDGTYTKIASGIPNTNTSVTDPHPALDYARYRIVAKDTTTGSISYYDAPGYPIKCSSIIIQWDEAWTTFDVSDEHSVEGPPWSGSLLKLEYNVDVADSRERSVSTALYAGREHPVSYYGTSISESASWNAVIPKEDKETIYALRRLSIWTGDVYIREPSGMGYWANVRVSFNQKFKDVTVPVTLNIIRVEGGV